MNRASLDRLHHFLAQSRLASWFALKLRNQAEAVLRARITPGIEIERNGESQLLRTLASSLEYVFDVGANRGQWIRALIGAGFHGRAVCFEPLPRARAALSTAIQGREFIEVSQNALSRREGVATIWEDLEHEEMSSLVSPGKSERFHELAVNVSQVDAELARRGWPRIDLLKIDAEGMDLEVLYGAEDSMRTGKVHWVQFEYSSAWRAQGATLAAAFRWLEMFERRAYLITPTGLCEFDVGRAGELFGYANFFAGAPAEVVKLFRVGPSSI